jgi:hypothetical protein
VSEELLDAFARLPALENYTLKDRHHDFRKTFGSTEGQKVLRYILEWGGVFNEPSLKSPVDPLMLAAHRGRRQIALGIFAIYNNEPPEQPDKATRKQTKR